jgi:hypothetical protein
VIEKWPANAIALISNSNLGHMNLPSPYVRLQAAAEPEVRRAVLSFTIEDFARIFELAKDKYPDVADCYRVRNLGLPNNALVYLIEHYNGAPRTMLVFGGTRLKGKLEQKLRVVNDILSNEPLPGKPSGKKDDEGPRPSGPEPRRPAPRASQEPPGFTLTNMRSILNANDDQLLAREDWLEARVGQLDYRQRVELEKIQAELRRRTKRRR